MADDVTRLDALIRETLTEDGRYLAESRADRFPKASVGKSCVRFKRLDDLDEGELRDLLAEAGRRPAAGQV